MKNIGEREVKNWEKKSGKKWEKGDRREEE